MTNLAAIQAQLVDMRNVGTHKSLKLTLHIPAERAMAAIEAFGWPTEANPVTVALARLNTESEVMRNTPAELRPADKTPPASVADSPVRARKPVAPDKRLAQQAGMCCADPRFWRFLRVADEAQASLKVRSICYVASRADIIPGTEAGDKWDALYSKYVAWRDAPGVAA